MNKDRFDFANNNTPPFVFHGNIRKVKIHSDIMSYSFWPKAGIEVEQHLTITEDGRVWLTRYATTEDFNYSSIKKTEQKQFKIAKEKAELLLGKFTKYFRDGYEPAAVLDGGNFEMWIDDDEGKTAHFIGPMISEISVDGYDLSQLVRDTLNDQALFVFDSNKYEKINRITIDYRHTDSAFSEYFNTDISWQCKEHLVIDRETETVEDVVQFSEQCDVTRKYHIADGVCDFLDNLGAEYLFAEFNKSEDVIPPTKETAFYEIKVEFQRQKPRIISGTYDKQGLPTDWPEFIEDLYDFISFYGFGEMFDKSVYARTHRKNDDYIFLSVWFNDYGKTYYYLTDDDTIEVGDQVKVPVGINATERIATVAEKEYFSEDDVPMPLDEVKTIIGRFVLTEEIEQ